MRKRNVSTYILLHREDYRSPFQSGDVTPRVPLEKGFSTKPWNDETAWPVTRDWTPKSVQKKLGARHFVVLTVLICWSCWSETVPLHSGVLLRNKKVRSNSLRDRVSEEVDVVLDALVSCSMPLVGPIQSVRAWCNASITSTCTFIFWRCKWMFCHSFAARMYVCNQPSLSLNVCLSIFNVG